MTSYFEFVRAVTVSCFSRSLQEAEEHTRKQMSICDPIKTEKSPDSGDEESIILSTQEEMFPENNAAGNNRLLAETKCSIHKSSQSSSLLDHLRHVMF